jgi:3-mercaptopyruvate sulfurtransferase SseA
MDEIDFKKEASKIIKIELTRQDLDYEQLAEKMKDIGIEETKANIANKLHRGTFSFAYVLQVFKALGLKKLNLEDLYSGK